MSCSNLYNTETAALYRGDNFSYVRHINRLNNKASICLYIYMYEHIHGIMHNHTQYKKNTDYLHK